nr:hypothetical protein [Streptacidiphilus rugosus]
MERLADRAVVELALVPHRHVRDQQQLALGRDRRQHLATHHGGGEGGRGEIGDAAAAGLGVRVRRAQRAVHRGGELLVEQPEHDPQFGLLLARVEDGLQIRAVVVGERHQGLRPVHPGGPEDLAAAELADDHRDPAFADRGQPGHGRVPLHHHDGHAHVVQTLHHRAADLAEADQHHVLVHGPRDPARARRGAQRAEVVQHHGGDRAQQHDAGEDRDDLQHLAGHVVAVVGGRVAGRAEVEQHVEEGETERVAGQLPGQHGQQHDHERQGEADREQLPGEEGAHARHEAPVVDPEQAPAAVRIAVVEDPQHGALGGARGEVLLARQQDAAVLGEQGDRDLVPAGELLRLLAPVAAEDTAGAAIETEGQPAVGQRGGDQRGRGRVGGGGRGGGGVLAVQQAGQPGAQRLVVDAQGQAHRRV